MYLKHHKQAVGTIGVNYGRIANNLPTPTNVVQLLKSQDIFLQLGQDQHLKMLLRESGVSGSSISILLANFPEALLQTSQEFSRVVEEVKEMGFDPKKLTFVLAGMP
ncbi:hypothetical protein K2173_027997 [Erythroxylum novogranatense]|uniref:Uncharacterized protein n=1 Tax=Erythroxylum novogranatense TaxID=1862640 RepID=A0AAV8U375_9ROSI|nr:hypothetical protein K2173_027997 [Erythroxylum novogranatense]